MFLVMVESTLSAILGFIQLTVTRTTVFSSLIRYLLRTIYFPSHIYIHVSYMPFYIACCRPTFQSKHHQHYRIIEKRNWRASEEMELLDSLRNGTGSMIMMSTMIYQIQIKGQNMSERFLEDQKSFRILAEEEQAVL